MSERRVFPKGRCTVCAPEDCSQIVENLKKQHSALFSPGMFSYEYCEGCDSEWVKIQREVIVDDEEVTAEVIDIIERLPEDGDGPPLACSLKKCLVAWARSSGFEI